MESFISYKEIFLKSKSKLISLKRCKILVNTLHGQGKDEMLHCGGICDHYYNFCQASSGEKAKEIKGYIPTFLRKLKVIASFLNRLKAIPYFLKRLKIRGNFLTIDMKIKLIFMIFLFFL